MLQLFFAHRAVKQGVRGKTMLGVILENDDVVLKRGDVVVPFKINRAQAKPALQGEGILREFQEQLLEAVRRFLSLFSL